MKILQLCLRVPFPPSDGGSIAMYNLQTAFLKNGAQIKVLAFNTIKHFVEPNELPAEYVQSIGLETIFLDNRVRPFSALLNLFTGDSYNIVRFIRRDFDEALAAILKAEQYDIIQLESLFMVPYLDTIQRLSKAKIVLRAHNIEHLIWERMAAQEKNPLKKWYLDLLARRLRQFEVWSLNKVDAIAAMTHEDEKAFRELGSKKPVFIAPIGIDTSSYHNCIVPKSSVFHLGAMDWLPNQEGVEWLVEKVWPVVLKLYPEAKLRLAGRNMPKRFFLYASNSISVEDFIDDAKSWMSASSVMAVPIFSGSGMRVKILEGMALGRAIVSTPVGIEGIPALDGSEVLIADQPEIYASYLVDLLKNSEKAIAFGLKGQEFVKKTFDNDVIARDLLNFYSKICN